MLRKHKVLVTVAVLLCLSLVVPSLAQAGIRDKFERFNSFNGFNGLNSSFKKLADLKGKMGSLNSSFNKLANLSTKFSQGFSPSFAKMATLGSGMSASLKPSFERMSSLKGISGDLKPSFAKMANLKGLEGGLKPSFVKMASLTANLTGAVKPSFAKLATFNANLVGKLRPSFEKLAKVKLSSELNSSLVKLASVNNKLSGSLNPTFSRLSKINAKMVPTISLGLQGLATRRVPVSVIGKTHALYTSPKGLKTIRLTARRPISFVPIATPINLQRLSVKPGELKSISAGEIAELVTRDLHLIQPLAGVKQPLQGLQTGPQNVSLMSLLAIEAK